MAVDGWCNVRTATCVKIHVRTGPEESVVVSQRRVIDICNLCSRRKVLHLLVYLPERAKMNSPVRGLPVFDGERTTQNDRMSGRVALTLRKECSRFLQFTQE